MRNIPLRFEGLNLVFVLVFKVLEEAKAVINDEKTEIEGRERDVSLVRNYWDALLCVEEWARKKKPLTEELIKRLHALVESGPRARPTPYREARNLLKDWVDDGWLEIADPSRRWRAYSLSAVYRQYIGSLSATAERQS
jgi:hypothetical protein